MRITKRKLRRIIREEINHLVPEKRALRESPTGTSGPDRDGAGSHAGGRYFVIIGNYGRGDQTAWPETDNPGLYTEEEALRIAGDQNEMDGAPSMGWQRRAHWHVQHVQDAHKYAPYIFSASPPYITHR